MRNKLILSIILVFLYITIIPTQAQDTIHKCHDFDDTVYTNTSGLYLLFLEPGDLLHVAAQSNAGELELWGQIGASPTYGILAVDPVNTYANIDYVVPEKAVYQITFNVAGGDPAQTHMRIYCIPQAGETVEQDNRMNRGRGDNYAIIAPGNTPEGPAIVIWPILYPTGFHVLLDPFIIYPSDLEGVPEMPEENYLVTETTGRFLGGSIWIPIPITFHVLTTGRYQITMGPDRSGNVHEFIFDGLEMNNLGYYSFNIYDFGCISLTECSD